MKWNEYNKKAGKSVKFIFDLLKDLRAWKKIYYLKKIMKSLQTMCITNILNPVKFNDEFVWKINILRWLKQKYSTSRHYILKRLNERDF